jgi:transketolase
MCKLIPNELRKIVLDLAYKKQSGHIGGSFSIAELVCVLYNNFDLISDNDIRDKIILSKGHAVPILYAALNKLGKISDVEMNTFREIDSRLQGHPDKVRMPLLNASTGALGQGLSIAIGHALHLKKFNKKVFCIIGDGEIQEGQVWEALMCAPKFKLDNLYCFLDYNKFQGNDSVKNTLPIDPIYDKLKSFNWNVIVMPDGNDYQALENTILNLAPNGTPTIFILNTTKGKGVSFMERNNAWHSKCPDEKLYEQAVSELI